MKDINIVFVNYKMREDIVKAIDSIFRDLSGSNINAQITVVDNSDNTDGIKDELDSSLRPPRLSPRSDRVGAGGEAGGNDKLSFNYLDARGNVGFGKGCNIGFAHTPARYFCTINPDTIIPENSKTIERIIKFMDENPKIGLIGPKLLNTDGSVQDSCYRFDLSSILIKPLKHINLDKKYKWVKKHADKLEMRDFDHNETRPVDWIMGSTMIARREACEAIGFFDGRYFMYLEDCDLCHKMWEAGWPVYYVHDIAIQHKHARDSAKVRGALNALVKNKLARVHLVSWFKYLWKWRKNHKYYAA